MTIRVRIGERVVVRRNDRDVVAFVTDVRGDDIDVSIMEPGATKLIPERVDPKRHRALPKLEKNGDWFVIEGFYNPGGW